MQVNRKQILFLGVLLVGLCINATSAFASSPGNVVSDFSKAYFMLDRSMENYLCEECKVNEDDQNIVELYFGRIEKEARSQGYKTSYFQMDLSKIKTEVLESDDETAKVRIKATMSRSINPFYRIFGEMFDIQDMHELDEVVRVVKDNGAWKIAPGAYNLPQ